MTLTPAQWAYVAWKLAATSSADDEAQDLAREIREQTRP